MVKLWNHKGRQLQLQLQLQHIFGITYIDAQQNLLLQATEIRYEKWP